MTTPSAIERLKAMHEAASRGPWELDDLHENDGHNFILCQEWNHNGESLEVASDLWFKDARLIVACRNLIGPMIEFLDASHNSSLPSTECIGSWISAASDDPKVCAEFKSAINKWFAAVEKLEQAIQKEVGAG